MMLNGRGRELAAAEDHSGADDKTARLTAYVDGRVQGVDSGWVRQQAVALGLTGCATNWTTGRSR